MTRPRLLLLAPLLWACGGDDVATGPASEQLPISAVAEAYLNAALDIMEANSIKRYEIDWPAFRERTFNVAGAAQTAAQTYPAIRSAIERIGDGHSLLYTGRDLEGESAQNPSPSASYLDGGIGYVEVPRFAGAGASLPTQYHELIEGVDTPAICGWVVDIRGNSGGNMWPMIAGVGPILGEGVVGAFIDPDSVVVPWRYEGGASWAGDGYAVGVIDPYELLVPNPPVAVLTDGLVASSGEATTIAFRGRPDTRSFGAGTRGLATANASFPLSDGAVLILAVAWMADRNGEVYPISIQPDEPTPTRYPPSRDPNTDETLAAAVQWLQSHPRCE